MNLSDICRPTLKYLCGANQPTNHSGQLLWVTHCHNSGVDRAALPLSDHILTFSASMCVHTYIYIYISTCECVCVHMYVSVCQWGILSSARCMCVFVEGRVALQARGQHGLEIKLIRTQWHVRAISPMCCRLKVNWLKHFQTCRQHQLSSQGSSS
jgi:hypothetical protein